MQITLFNSEIKKRDRWVKRIINKIKKGNAQKVIKELGKYQDKDLPSGAQYISTLRTKHDSNKWHEVEKEIAA